MQQILILGGGAAGLAAALAAAQTAEGRAHITVLDKNAKVGKKLLATGNGRCNLDKLSMGMSGDYDVAIGFGATSVRVGSAIFGTR